MTQINRLCMIVIAVLAWIAFGFHLEMNRMSAGGLWIAGFWRQIDYFTETTNILVAITFSWFGWRARGPIASRDLATAVLSVAIVVLVYWPVLYPKFPPKPGTEGSNVLIHAIIPALVMGYYVLFTQKGTASRTDPLRWLMYPLSYLLFVELRGVFTEKYPYFFLNPLKVGWLMALVYGLLIGLIYLGGGYALLLLDKRKWRRA